MSEATGADIRAAIDRATSLTNPRLSEVMTRIDSLREELDDLSRLLEAHAQVGTEEWSPEWMARQTLLRRQADLAHEQSLSMKIVADHLLDLLNEGVDLIERGDLHIVSEDGADGFVSGYRWPKVGSWHRILAWKGKVAEQLVRLGERRSTLATPSDAPEKER